MNNLGLTALLAEEHRAEFLRQAERYRRARDGKGGSRALNQAKGLWLAAFPGRTARPVAASGGIPSGTAKTRRRRGPRPSGARFTDPNATAPTIEPAPAPHPQAQPHDNHPSATLRFGALSTSLPALQERETS